MYKRAPVAYLLVLSLRSSVRDKSLVKLGKKV
jgi:hypothetical protein